MANTKPRLETRKTVVFNLANEADRTLWEYASRTNFSQLVRRYLAMDMRKKVTTARVSLDVQHSDAPVKDLPGN